MIEKIYKKRFEKIYRYENDINVKERMLIVLNVVYEKKIITRVERDIKRRRKWVYEWLKRYREEGVEGLKNRKKSGRKKEIRKEII